MFTRMEYEIYIRALPILIPFFIPRKVRAGFFPRARPVFPGFC